MRMLILLVVASIYNLEAQNFDLLHKRVFVTKSGFELPYRISYPENFNKAGKLPVVLLLHGAGERGSDNESQLIHAAADFQRNSSEYPCILVIPQCPKDSYWSSVIVNRESRPIALDFDYDRKITLPLSAAIDLTKSVVRREGGDRNRIYITGLSMGGMGTFEAVFRFPSLFAAAVPVCGAGSTAAYGKRQKRVPFWIFHGGDDQTVSVEESRSMTARLKDLGGQVQYTAYPEVGHNSWDNAYREDGLFDWLFSQKK